MSKAIVFLLLGFFSFTLINAQKGSIKIGVGPQIAFPVSNQNFSYYYKNGIGGKLQVDLGVTKLGYIFGEVSYQNMKAKNLPVINDLSLTMIQAGYKTRFLNSGFFTGADAGIAKYSSGKNNFVISGTIGYTFKLSNRTSLDFSPSYSQIFGTGNNNQWINIATLWRFNLVKVTKK